MTNRGRPYLSHCRSKTSTRAGVIRRKAIELGGEARSRTKPGAATNGSKRCFSSPRSSVVRRTRSRQGDRRREVGGDRVLELATVGGDVGLVAGADAERDAEAARRNELGQV